VRQADRYDAAIMAQANRLAAETSPYLLQHAHNPVDWYPWGTEAFDRARAEHKPILLSIGYSSCHWCHVMERESFENPDTARLMNELFVNVKVDREERPDVDEVYMRAVQLLIGRGGWPLTVFLTPEGEPFYGGTYFPPVDRHGLPAFPRVLRAVAEAYRERPAEVAKAIAQLVHEVQAAETATPSEEPLDVTLPRRAAEALLRYVDTDWGGLGGAPKFPHPQVFQLLLRRWKATGEEELLDAVRLTCRRMAEGGMYDQIGGGFHRYSVDARWLVPHFEKMLYDNAQLPRLYVDAWQATGDAAFARIARDVCQYVLREMRHPDGAFFSATDADSEGEEGKFFVWTPAEVASVVDPADVELVCRVWDITEEGNFEGKSIPHVSLSADQAARLFGRTPADVEAALERARCRLYGLRAQRVPPGLDDKILTGWNGLMIGTLATVGFALEEPRFIEAAVQAADFIWTALRRDGRLLHGWAKGQARGQAFLDDYAFLASACLDLYEASGDVSHLVRARALVAQMQDYFHDGRGGGYFFAPHDGERLIARSKPAQDGALPAGNAVAALVHLRLHALDGEDWHRERAEEILRLWQEQARRNPFGFATWLEALERWHVGATEIVIVGRKADPGTVALRRVVGKRYLPHRVVVQIEPEAADRPAVARDRHAVDGRPTAWVCHHFSCAPPAVEPDVLEGLLL